MISPIYHANTLYAPKLYNYIVDNQFDTFVMPHPFPAEALTYMFRKHKCRPDVYTYLGGKDYTRIPFTEETEAEDICELIIRMDREKNIQ